MAADSRICADTHNGLFRGKVYYTQSLYVMLIFCVHQHPIHKSALCKPPATLSGLISTLSKWSNILGIASLMLNLVDIA